MNDPLVIDLVCAHCGKTKHYLDFPLASKSQRRPARGGRDYRCRDCFNARKRNQRKEVDKARIQLNPQFEITAAQVAGMVGTGQSNVNKIERQALAKLRIELEKRGYTREVVLDLLSDIKTQSRSILVEAFL